ncbi:MBL fold metallo-hydrolase [Halovivax sp.]|uniref:MBL fold metallo-hydrolase n=1 Tax=Halovivax sp. TaxID=1935978 RepID=UPI0025BF61C6|nr:MBL fold metallo-hydrolase [Halovivax sp.]
MPAESPAEPAAVETPASVHRLEFDVPWPPRRVAAYLLDGPQPILVDAGPPGDDAEAALEEQLAAVGLALDDIEHVVLTHPHVDHVGLVPALRGAGAEIHAAGEELDQLRRDEAALEASAREVGRGAGLTGEELSEAVERAVESLRRNRGLVAPDETTPIAGSGPVDVGDRRFEAIHAPGHQCYHTCLETTVDGRRLLFSGDALIESFRPGLLHVGLDRGAYEAVDAFRDGLDRLGESDAGLALPGHGPVFADVSGVVEWTRNELDRLVAETRAGVDAVGPATPLAITTERVGHQRHPIQLLDTLGALGTLESDGAVEKSMEDGVRYYRRSS